MRKSDPTTTDNVITFAKRQKKHASATRAHPQNQGPRVHKGRQGKASSECRPPVYTGTADDVRLRHRRRVEILTSKGNPTPELIDELAPGLVRNVLRRVGSGECAGAKLPKPLLRRLDLMCSFKNPAALIIKDWLDGNRRSLPGNLQTIADYSTCAVEEEQ